MDSNYIYEYLQKLQNYLEYQNKKIKRLEERIRQLEDTTKKLETEITSLKERPTSIEYKFDQLKVETLSGTLNIGLSPKSEAIDDFSVNTSTENSTLEEKYLKLLNQIKKEIDVYLNNEANKVIGLISEKHKKPLEPPYYQLIIDDINKQIEQRIRLYINKLGNQPSSNEEEIKLSIIEKIKNDINSSIEAFVKQLPRRE